MLAPTRKAAMIVDLPALFGSDEHSVALEPEGELLESLEVL